MYSARGFNPGEMAQIAPRPERGARAIGPKTSKKSVTGVRFSEHIDEQISPHTWNSWQTRDEQLESRARPKSGFLL
jgi:hypothetical protein